MSIKKFLLLTASLFFLTAVSPQQAQGIEKMSASSAAFQTLRPAKTEVAPTMIVPTAVPTIMPVSILWEETFRGKNVAMTLKDDRTKILRAYLEEQNSPLAEYAGVFVSEADKNDLDWKLVAAIAGVESSFGLHIPPYSYNGWGFGVYGNNVLRFSSWDEGIAEVSGALRQNYINRGAENIYEIGSMYAADPNWANKVTSFMNKIAAFHEESQNTTLYISL